MDEEKNIAKGVTASQSTPSEVSELDVELQHEPSRFQKGCQMNARPHSGDPIQWSWRKKHTTLFIVTFTSFLARFGGTIAIPAVVPQSLYWNEPAQHLQEILAIAQLCSGCGAFISVIMAHNFGKLPVLFAFQVVATIAGIICASAQTYQSYFIARAFNTIFCVAGQAGALLWIKEMFHEDEHRKKINLWFGLQMLGSELGPMLSAFIIAGSTWRWSFWLYNILNAIALILIIAFLDEPERNCNALIDSQPKSRRRLEALLGISQWRARWNRPPVLQTIVKPFRTVTRLPVILCLIYAYVVAAWLLGVTTTSAVWMTTFYHFTPVDLGIFYFAPLVGVGVATTLGHWAHDGIAAAWTRRDEHRMVPEVRLLITIPASVVFSAAAIVIGFALENTWHYMVFVVGFAVLYGSSIIALTAVSAYLVQVYPDRTLESGMWLFLAKTLGGFMATYIQLPWIQAWSPAAVLSTQAGLAIAAMLLIALLVKFGGKIRFWQDGVLNGDQDSEQDMK